jgi:hypothetical protein
MGTSVWLDKIGCAAIIAGHTGERNLESCHRMPAFEAMKVSELRARLQAAGLSTEGKKADLVARYANHCSTEAVRSASPSPTK